ncbi:ribonucleotide reductase [Mycobacterium phage BTCU-1]|uniref:Ribonucleotide reductase n=1 Tax=Mycobacterium phage BTCU-1 TaxID=1262532 RepID=R9R4L0_9CAUD|nr:ribonucleotide reductase [Mycobacterium phage BTCU-1]AGI61706.1 ribonucleotide reductase [Mycobacterium phage BTCU-1]
MVIQRELNRRSARVVFDELEVATALPGDDTPEVMSPSQSRIRGGFRRSFSRNALRSMTVFQTRSASARVEMVAWLLIRAPRA